MDLTPKQCARFSVLAGQTEMSQIEGFFCSDDTCAGLPPQEMAMALWQAGYLPAATVDALLEAMEKEMHRRSADTAYSH